MKVFLTGATGNIGSAVAERLLAAGHEILGLARSEEAVEKLQGMGVEPHSGDLTNLDSLTAGARGADAVIHAGAAQTAGMERGEIDRNAVMAMLEALESSDKPFLYTSDQLIYGSTGEEPADEDATLDPPPFIAWRAELEKEVLAFAERGVRTMAIRPVAVYGRGRGGMAMFVEGAKMQGAAYYVNDGQVRWSTVHVNDLADLYVKMLEEAPASTLLNAAAEPPVAMKDMMEAVGRAAGVETKGLPLEEAREVLGPMVPVDGFATNLVVSAERAREMLGWKPKEPSVVEDLDRTYVHG